MSVNLPPFPVDEATLAALEHALDAHFDDNGEPAGADFDLHRVLEFCSGYDPDKVVVLDDTQAVIRTEYVGGPLYTLNDVIRSLIVEVKRLRWALRHL